MTMTKSQIKTAIDNNIKGQFNQIDISGKLADILTDTVDNIPEAQVQSDWNQVDDTKVDFIKNKPTIPTAAGVLASLTLESSATSFSDASDLAKADAATALGITGDELDALMSGEYMRFAYGTNHAKILAVDSADGASLSMGAGYLKVTYATEKYAIDVA